MSTKHSRRSFLQTLAAAGIAATGMSLSNSAFAQGKCRDGYGTPACPLSEATATAPIKPLFAPTGWKTVGLDHITFSVPDYQKEAAFFISLMGWRLRSDNGTQAILDIGDWGSAILKKAPQQPETRVTNFCFIIDPWNAKTVERELRKRGLDPVAENNGEGFESFHVKDPDGWDLQLSNDKGLAHARQIAKMKTPAAAKLNIPMPFAATGWNTVWLDHISFKVTDYKKSASFYSNLIGWKQTYDEGSQAELMIGDIGDVIIRGGNRNDPNFGKANSGKADFGRADFGKADLGKASLEKNSPSLVPSAQVDHISFGISPWDTDKVKAELEKRGLRAQVDTSTHDDIHVSAYKSYHTTTPNGYDLQISFVTHDNRLALSNAVNPKP